MLKWFADRLAHQGSEVRKDERGFTLIELLVVVIIIGILAAIAIPTFLGQRDSAEDSAAQTNLRNAATAQQAFFTEGGNYTGDETALEDFGFPTAGNPDVTITDPAASATGPTYCMEADGATGTFYIADDSNAPTTTAC